ncbi:MAG: MFS transporter [Desulfatiglandaceae bacterium]|jgi:MFS transporter, DHA1 family, inner membrane transport protein
MSTNTHRDPGLAPKVTAAVFCRILLNTARRFAYPFAPVLSRGLGVPITAVTRLIATNEVPSVFGIFFGPIIDRVGSRKIMLTGLVLLFVGMLTAGIFPFYWVVWMAFLLAGFGKSLFDPAIQAYAGNRVPFGRRGLVIGLLEFSWAGSTLFGIPIVGFLIARINWRAPFFVLGCLAVVGLLTLAVLFPPDRSTNAERPARKTTNHWWMVSRERAGLGAVLFGFFISLANDSLFVVYGAWLEKTFSLSVTALGLGTSVIGAAELAGEGLTASLSDRFGLKRSVLWGLVVSTACYAAFPFLGKDLSLALFGLFIVFLSFEFTIVTSFSLCTELLPGSRGTMMATFLAAAGAGRVTGAMIGGTVWTAGGIPLTITVSLLANVLAFLSLFWGLYHWTEP